MDIKMKLRCCICGGLEYLLFLILFPIYKWAKKKWVKHHDYCDKCSCKEPKIEYKK